MKPFLPAVALLVAAIAFAAHAQTRKQIVAGPIEATGDGISGSFRVRESHRAGILSDGTGGACLVAAVGDRTCRNDDDCDDLRMQYPGGAAYCLGRPGMNRHRTCWVRPGADVAFCLKSPVAPLPPDTRIELPRVDPRVIAGGHGVRWRVHACLNGYNDVARADNHACADATATHRMTSDGPPRRIP